MKSFYMELLYLKDLNTVKGKEKYRMKFQVALENVGKNANFKGAVAAEVLLKENREVRSGL
jgi:hypothetical protein